MRTSLDGLGWVILRDAHSCRQALASSASLEERTALLLSGRLKTITDADLVLQPTSGSLTEALAVADGGEVKDGFPTLVEALGVG